MGPQGLRETAELCVRKAHYAKQRLTANSRLSLPFHAATFKEFVVRDKGGRVSDLLSQASGAGYLAGLPLGQWYPQLDDCFLVTIAEKRTKAEIDGLAEVLSARRENAAPKPHTRLASVFV